MILKCDAGTLTSDAAPILTRDNGRGMLMNGIQLMRPVRDASVTRGHARARSRQRPPRLGDRDIMPPIKDEVSRVEPAVQTESTPPHRF